MPTTTGFTVNGTDLSAIFAPKVTNATAATGFISSSGFDLNAIFAPRGEGGAAAATGFKITVSPGVYADLNTVFCAIGTWTGVSDTTLPSISVFTVPSTASSLTISGIQITAYDNVGITGYLITENATTPSLLSINLSTAPTTYTVSSTGTYSLYLWAKDAAGNIRSSGPVTCTVTDSVKPTILNFSVPSTSSSLTITGITLTASDAFGVTGYKITESATKPGANDVGWISISPSAYVASTSGVRNLYCWAKDAAGNVSDQYTMRTCTVTLGGAQTTLKNNGTDYSSWGDSVGGYDYMTGETIVCAAGYVSFYYSLYPDVELAWAGIKIDGVIVAEVNADNQSLRTGTLSAAVTAGSHVIQFGCDWLGNGAATINTFYIPR